MRCCPSGARALLPLAVLLTTLPSLPASAQVLGVLDSSAPELTVLAPASGATVTGRASVEARASDGLLGSGVSRVEYQVDTTAGAWTALSLDAVAGTWKAAWDTTLTRDGGRTLYVRATDGAGNASLAAVSVRVANPPAVPTGLAVVGPAAPSNGGYLDLSWDANAEADLHSYGVYRSTVAGGPYTRVAGVVGTRFRDEGRANGVTYYYALTAVDTAGNESPRSALATGVAYDTAWPVVSNVRATPLEPGRVSVTWTTDEGATGQVEYGTSPALGSATSVDTRLLTQHAFTLTGLSVGVTYYFRVRSADGAGHTTSSDVGTFSTGVDEPPAVTLVSPTEGALLPDRLTMQVQASDAQGLAAVETTLDGLTWTAAAFNSLSGHYETRVDTTGLEEGWRKVGARARDTAGQSTLASANVLVDHGPPALTLLSPEVDAHLNGGAVHPVRVSASDAGSGLAQVEWQLHVVPFGVEVEAAPPPDAAAWQPLTLDPQSGQWGVDWTPALVPTERVVYLYVRASDALGRVSETVREVTVLAVGRDFAFLGSAGQSLTGTAAIAPDATGQSVLGLQVVGRDLTPGGSYSVTISGEGERHTASFTADARGRGVVSIEVPTAMTDVFAAELVPGGPGF